METHLAVDYASPCHTPGVRQVLRSSPSPNSVRYLQGSLVSESPSKRPRWHGGNIANKFSRQLLPYEIDIMPKSNSAATPRHGVADDSMTKLSEKVVVAMYEGLGQPHQQILFLPCLPMAQRLLMLRHSHHTVENFCCHCNPSDESPMRFLITSLA